MTYINNFGDVGPGDVAVAGGKGVGLGGLVQAGLPVPPGFVLNTAAYADFVQANHLEAGIQELAAVSPQASPQDYEDASTRIRDLFAAGTMPAAIAAELGAAYGRLGNADTAVAVRSSATAEDLASASFAGQQETYLNIRGAEALAAAVTDCWASLWTARAMAYRAREGIGPDAVRLAVVVQQMVEAEAAGVMFTANPANGRRDQIVISAAWGLGESVVSGTVTTDDVVVEAGTGWVLSRRTADKEVMTVYADSRCRRRGVVSPSWTTRRRPYWPAMGHGLLIISGRRRTSSGHGPAASSSSCNPGPSPHCLNRRLTPRIPGRCPIRTGCTSARALWSSCRTRLRHCLPTSLTARCPGR